MTSPSRPSYLRAWRHLPRDLGFLLAGLPLAVAGFVVVVTLVVTGVALTIIWVGIPIGIGGLLAGRAFGTLDLQRLDAAGQTPIERPQWSLAEARRPASSGAGATRAAWLVRTARTVRRVPGDGRYWVYVVYATVVNFTLSLISWVFAVVWAAGAAGGLTYWIWSRYLPQPDSEGLWLYRIAWQLVDPRRDIAPSPDGALAAASILYLLCGVVFLVTLPPIASAFVAAHHGVARAMLGEWRSVALERRASQAEASRESAVIAEDRSLRRLERDIHDGPQQRLIRLQFDLASAQRRLADDPDAAAELLDGALQQSKDALEELRELSRGFAPPILQDRGLEAAVLSLAARSPLAVTTDIALADAPPALAEVERSAYFIVSELLTNATKHAGAARASVALSVSGDAGAGADNAQTLNLLVTDDGHGGAIERPGHGLAGVRERLAGLRGTLTVTSPVGGPTTIGAQIPLPRGHE